MAGQNSVRYPDGRVVALDGASTHELRPGEVIIGLDSGGGYGDPRLREPERVLDDVLEGWETVERARDLYCVMVTRSDDGISYQIDGAETARLRSRLFAEL